VDKAHSTHGEMRNVHEILVRKVKGRDHMGELGIKGTNWICLAQGRIQ
jgi:hypothetical protein